MASGGFLGIYGIATLTRALVARRWHVATAEIIASQIGSEYSPSARRVRWDATVRYRYQFRGKEYETDRISFGSLAIFGWQRISQRVHAKYPLGAKVTVRVCPTHPSLAVLEVGPSVVTWGYIVIGTGLLTIGVRGMLSTL